MPRVDNFYYSSDFDTIKNDATGTALLVVPPSDVVAAGATATYETTVSVGEAASILNIAVTNNVTYPAGDYFTMTSSVSFQRTGSLSYTILIRFVHSGGSNIRLIASILNSAASPLTLSATTDSFTFKIKTIKAPRFS